MHIGRLSEYYPPPPSPPPHTQGASAFSTLPSPRPFFPTLRVKIICFVLHIIFIHRLPVQMIMPIFKPMHNLYDFFVPHGRTSYFYRLCQPTVDAH